ncbi:non-ribosomal peptide synthetase [Anopheles sinensis]|uniref:Non-ribosomal peptide synthetase n=1 Tax=Anopheles sinensis TaxID=74873 RepID=A0A084WT95_ANOSI|nr:non-ribosomal peptide synthetase [Anopheles sinensis]
MYTVLKISQLVYYSSASALGRIAQRFDGRTGPSNMKIGICTVRPIHLDSAEYFQEEAALPHNQIRLPGERTHSKER